VSFLNEIRASARFPLAPANAIVVFSGEPRRIRTAVNFLKKGLGQQLFIVGQDNTDEIEIARRENRSLFKCCVEIDNRSKNTFEDAFLARKLLLKKRSKSLILVTSSFHVPRAKKELRRLLPDMQINSYGVADDSLKVKNIFSDPNMGPVFLAQYLKFIAVSLPHRRLFSEARERRILQFTSDGKSLILLIVAIGAFMFAAFAFSKHRISRRSGNHP
jgi:uncharacterized SAM-binding protein YcdF (DUF218 family)